MEKIVNTYKFIKAGLLDRYRRFRVARNLAIDKRYINLSFSKYIVAFIMVLAVASGNWFLFNPQKPISPATNHIAQSTKTKPLTTNKQEIEFGVAMSLADVANLPIKQDLLINSEVEYLKKELSSQVVEATTARVVPIFDISLVKRNIHHHTVEAGQTTQSIADQYNISVNTLKWNNNLKTNELQIGQKLKILPIDGVLYKVKVGDNLDAIAKKYKSNTQRIQTLNDLEVSGLVPGREIIVPEGIVPLEERPDYVPPRPVYVYTGPIYGGGSRTQITVLPNNYSGKYQHNRGGFAGQCVWYAYRRRVEIGRGFPGSGPIGHAYQWYGRALSLGMVVNKTPAPGAIFQTSAGGGGYGHVGVVERVLPNGDLYITEMNYRRPYEITGGIIPAGQVKQYNYIH